MTGLQIRMYRKPQTMLEIRKTPSAASSCSLWIVLKRSVPTQATHSAYITATPRPSEPSCCHVLSEAAPDVEGSQRPIVASVGTPHDMIVCDLP